MNRRRLTTFVLIPAGWPLGSAHPLRTVLQPTTGSNVLGTKDAEA